MYLVKIYLLPPNKDELKKRLIKRDSDSLIEVEKRLSLGDDFITTIFHEMTHVKQLVYREFFTECNFYESREEYLNLPWEVEAYAKQEELLEQWNKHKKTS